MLSKAALQEWISIALMSPGIPVYVTGVTLRMMVCPLCCCIDPISNVTGNYLGKT
jgi:hypothetical protein